MRSSPEIDIELPQLAPTPERVGRYRICGELASGGMASVYLAISEGDTQPGAPSQGAFAIKRVHPHLARQREFVEMFVDEARIASRIRHPNVCSVLEWGECDGTFFLVMELLEGEPVVTLLRGSKRQPSMLDDPRWARCAARIIADACAGLHAAHELADDSGEPMQVVHRDISPHNLFVTWDGITKVVDFGVASAKHRLHQTTTGTVKGKFAYMAPEQLQGGKADRRADVWSLGVVLWELLAGRSLFRRPVESETIVAVLGGAVPPLASVRSGAPAALEGIARRALAHGRDERTPSALAMRDELEAWLASEGGFETDDVREMIEQLLPGQREAYEQRALRAIAGGTSIVPRPQRESTSPTAAAPRSAVLRKGRHGARIARAMEMLALIAMAAGALVVGTASGAGNPSGGAPAPLAREALSTEPALDLASPPAGAPADAIAPAPAVAPPEAPAYARVVAVPPAETTARAEARRAVRPVASGPSDLEDDGSGVGSLDVSTPGGWAEVWLGGQRIGHTPGRFELPAGRHTLLLRPGAGGAEERVPVRIVGGQLARVRVDLVR